MKKRSLLLILVLTISLAIPIFIAQTQPVYTEPIITPSKTYQIPINLTTIPNATVNFTVTTNIRPLIEGNVGGFTIGIYAAFYSPDPTVNVTQIIINNNSQIKIQGIMLPISKAFESDVDLYGPVPLIPLPYWLNLPTYPDNTTFFALVPSAYETVLLLSDTTGFPCQVSFTLSVTIVTRNTTDTYDEPVSLDSAAYGGPAVSVVLPNYAETPLVITIYTYSLLLLVFLLPITLVVIDWRMKVHKLKEESDEGV